MGVDRLHVNEKIRGLGRQSSCCHTLSSRRTIEETKLRSLQTQVPNVLSLQARDWLVSRHCDDISAARAKSFAAMIGTITLRKTADDTSSRFWRAIALQFLLRCKAQGPSNY